jgi:3-oxoacyl-[acyl-carrier protein] reductase
MAPSRKVNENRNRTMTSDLKGKTAIVTGAGRGLGREYAQKFAVARANVVAGNALNYADSVAAIKAAGGDAISVPLDVRDQASCDTMAEQAMASFGRIDVLVNNAAL